MLQVYNSLTRKKEEFKTIVAGKVGMYVCGMTVYDYCHVGHARTFLAFDVITRYLRAKGYKLTYVRNITDVDDKIIKRANENGENAIALADRFVMAMHEDFACLDMLAPDQEPRATQTITQMQVLISELINKDMAYVADNGDVYYRVEKFAEYGKLSNQSIEDLRCGARVEVGEIKENPLDFVLWKAAKPDEPFWESPWGQGRPGWHIECSAMSREALGLNFDIHGGGGDLSFPHHENEIAQSEVANNQPYANYWLHTGMLQINKEKMSKSLGNFFTIRDVLKEIDAETLRYFLISSHYRSVLNYSKETVMGARSALTRIYTALKGIPENSPALAGTSFEARFYQAMDDDFNVPEALAVLFELVREINRLREESLEKAAPYAGLLKQLAGVLGIAQSQPEAFLQGGQCGSEFDTTVIEALIVQRNQARDERNWLEADRVRDELLEQGIILEDNAAGTSWKRK
ncbi:cysteine--tRNA ligase [Piscirickettsia salmonis]|uniref:cysteine--tRNA ligase n=1 Tax=Piscirickettsia salmonis TaxID=1238 RepID=UPI000F094FA0|nr:cysteine--tRNA ligase [Piscirickettsiaceae bacterium NZ-RLO2]